MQKSLLTAALAPPQAYVRGELADIYALWFTPVYRWIRALGGPSADAEDLVQEVFLVVQRKLDDFDGENLAGWLYRITQRTVKDHRRRAWFRHVFSRPATVDLEHFADAGADEVVERADNRRAFFRVVEKMNRKWRSSFVLFEIVGHSTEEIALLEGIPAATVRTHLHRARKEFLALCEQETL